MVLLVLSTWMSILLLVFCNHKRLPLLTTVLFHILVLLPSFSFVSIFRFPFLPEHPLFEDATVFRCVLSGSQLWRAPSPHPTCLPALPNHHSPYGSQRRGTHLPLSRNWGKFGWQRQLLRGGRCDVQLVSLQPDFGRPANQMWQLQVRDEKPWTVSDARMEWSNKVLWNFWERRAKQCSVIEKSSTPLKA